MEKVWEDVRREHYPDRPSRVGNTFICPDYKSAVKWVGHSHWRIFEVKYSGKAFRGDARWWNMRGRDYEEWAHEYWKGQPRGGEYPELIVKGPVEIVREMDSGKDEARKRRTLKKLDQEDREKWLRESTVTLALVHLASVDSDDSGNGRYTGIRELSTKDNEED
jgi:hypothetical protein